MSATTINTFPSLHSWSSPRSWALAIIVLLHLGFFWVLTNGLSVSIPNVFVPEAPIFIPMDEPHTPPPPPPPVVDVIPTPPQITAVQPDIKFTPDEQPMPPNAPYVEPTPTRPGDFTNTGEVAPPAPVVVEPRVDSRRGLTEPFYPPQSIRENQEGTVVLALYILANGRVGEVKLEQTSGHPKLDESAMREAKRWRFVPGTSDGQATAMWKKMPVTFKLNK